jgi:hypothetical protein
MWNITTGVFQTCDVRIQRIFKHSLKRSYHEDVVGEILQQIENGDEKIVAEKENWHLTGSECLLVVECILYCEQ